jgi:hypothetical protein
MNRRLLPEILEIIAKLDEKEIKDFVKISNKRKSHTSKGHKYIQLFYDLLKVNLNDFDEDKFRNSISYTDSVNDLSKKLADALNKFLKNRYEIENTTSTEYQLKELLAQSKALFQRGLLLQAWQKIEKADRIILKLKTNTDELRLLEYLIFEISTYKTILFYKLPNNEKEKYYDLINDDYFDFFRQISHNYKRILEKYENKYKRDKLFAQASFFHLLNIFSQQQQEFDERFNLLDEFEKPYVSKIINEKENTNVKLTTSQVLKEELDQTKRLVLLIEKLYLAIALDKRDEFNNIRNKINGIMMYKHSEIRGFYNALAIIVSNKLFELDYIYNSKLQKRKSIVVYSSYPSISLYKESEIDDFIFRIELNRIIVLFSSREYLKCIDSINKLGQFKPNDKIDRDITILMILAKFMNNDYSIEAHLKHLEYLNKKLDQTNQYYKDFYSMVRSLENDNKRGEKRHEVCKQAYFKLSENHEDFNVIHNIIKTWFWMYAGIGEIEY